jgi:hypothetical protein
MSGHSPSQGLPGDRKPKRGSGEPEEHHIRERARQIWVEEGKPDGRKKEHWLGARGNSSARAKEWGTAERGASRLAGSMVRRGSSRGIAGLPDGLGERA